MSSSRPRRSTSREHDNSEGSFASASSRQAPTTFNMDTMQVDREEAEDVGQAGGEDEDERLTAASIASLGRTTRTRFPGVVLSFSEELRLMNDTAEILQQEGAEGAWEESDEQRLSFLRLAVGEPGESFLGAQRTWEVTRGEHLWEQERAGEGEEEDEYDESMRSDVELEFEDEDETAAEAAAADALLPFPARPPGPILAGNFLSTLLTSTQRATAQAQTSSLLPNPNPLPLPPPSLPPTSQSSNTPLIFHAGTPALRRGGIGSSNFRTTPTLAATPPTLLIPASGSNRLSVIGRTPSSRNRFDNTTAAATRRTGNYAIPFPVPEYLRHSNFASQLVTTDAAVDGEREGEGVGGGEEVKKGVGLVVRKEEREKQILLPTCWNEEDKCALIELKSDGVGVHFAGSAKYGDRDAAAVRTNRPIPSQTGVYYWEVTIVDKGLSGYIGIGFSHGGVSLSRLPGWEANSWGYHGDDGRAFCCLGTGEKYGPTFTTGDVIGCGIDWTGMGSSDKEEGVVVGETKGKNKEKEKEKKKEDQMKGGRAFFVKNGKFLGYAFADLYGDLYPSVGLRTPGEVVSANFGSKPFRYAIDSFVRERQRSVLAAIRKTPISSSLYLPSDFPSIPSSFPTTPSEDTNETLQSLISSYLIHHGYTTSAQAFSQQISEERKERCTGLVIAPDPKEDSTDIEMTAVKLEHEESPYGEYESDSALRSVIREAFFGGNIGKVLDLVNRHYAAVLTVDQDAAEGGIYFKLLMRSFVEELLEGGRGGTTTNGEVSSADATTTSPNPRSLESLLTLGRHIHNLFGEDTRPLVQERMKVTLGLLAYDHPETEGGEVGWIVSTAAREQLADELNSAILVSQSLPPKPALETLFRHTCALVTLLGEKHSVGAAVLVDAKKELLSMR